MKSMVKIQNLQK